MFNIRRFGALFLALCMVFGALPSIAQAETAASATYFGKVVDASGEGLGGVTVAAQGQQNATVKTNDQGKWSFSLLAGSAYTFSFDKEGYVFGQTVSGKAVEKGKVDCGVVNAQRLETPPLEPEKQPDPAPAPIVVQPIVLDGKTTDGAKQDPPSGTQPSGQGTVGEADKTVINAPVLPLGGSSQVIPDKTEGKLPSNEPEGNTPPTPAIVPPVVVEGPTTPVNPSVVAGQDNVINHFFAAITGGSDKTSVTQTEVVLAAPSFIAPPTVVNTDAAALVWTEVPSAESYEITLQDITSGQQILNETVTGTNRALAGLVSGHQYKATVRAVSSKTSPSAQAVCVFDCMGPVAPVLPDPQVIPPIPMPGALQTPIVLPVAPHSLGTDLTVLWQGDAQAFALDLSYQEGDAWRSVWSSQVPAGSTQATIPAGAFAAVGTYRFQVTASAQGAESTTGAVTFQVGESRKDEVPQIALASVIMPFFTSPDSIVTTMPVTFGWQPIEGAKYYQFSLSTKQGQILLNNIVVNGLSYVHTGALVDGAEYVASVRAVFGYGTTGVAAQLAFKYQIGGAGRIALAAPAITTPVGDVAAFPVTVTWTAVPNAVSYQIIVYDERTQLNIINARTVTGTQYTLDASLAAMLTAGSTYQIHVCAMPQTGSPQYLQSTWATKSFVYRPSTKLAAPVVTYPAVNETVAAGTVTFRWNAVPGAYRYSVSLNGANLASVTGTSWTVNALPAASYTFTVQAHVGFVANANDSDVTSVPFIVGTWNAPSITNLQVAPSSVALGQGYQVLFTAQNIAANAMVRLLVDNSVVATTTMASIRYINYGNGYVWMIPTQAYGVGDHAIQLQLSNDGGINWLAPSTSAKLTVLSNALGNPKIDPIPDQRAGTDISVTWEAVAGAGSYTVTLRRNGENAARWSGNTATPNITIPAYYTTVAGAYQLTVTANPPTGAQINAGSAAISFNIVTTSPPQPYGYGWIQAYSATLYGNASPYNPIGTLTWNEPFRIVGESGDYYQIATLGQVVKTGFVLKYLVGPYQWSPCQNNQHNLVTKYEPQHPHWEYVECTQCHYKAYTGRVGSNVRPEECCLCGNHAWGKTVASRKHPHSTGTQTCTRCGEKKTVKLRDYKFKDCDECYPDVQPAPVPTSTASSKEKLDAFGNRLYDTGEFRLAFDTSSMRSGSYAYVPKLYEKLREMALADQQNNRQQIPLRMLFAACFTPVTQEWQAETYRPVREATYRDFALAFVTALFHDAVAKQELAGAPNAVQLIAGDVSSALKDVLGMEDILDTDARAQLVVIQEQLDALAASTPQQALVGKGDDAVKALLAQVYGEMLYDEVLVDKVLLALEKTREEPDSVRALAVAQAVVEVKHVLLSELLEALPNYATQMQVDDVLAKYQQYVLSLVQLYGLAQQVGGTEVQPFETYWQPEATRQNNVRAAYENMIEE